MRCIDGEFKNDLRDGRGDFSFEGSFYEGEWKADIQHGRGCSNLNGL